MSADRIQLRARPKPGQQVDIRHLMQRLDSGVERQRMRQRTQNRDAVVWYDALPRETVKPAGLIAQDRLGRAGGAAGKGYEK